MCAKMFKYINSHKFLHCHKTGKAPFSFEPKRHSTVIYIFLWEQTTLA
jgi:hypothetical protein